MYCTSSPASFASRMTALKKTRSASSSVSPSAAFAMRSSTGAVSSTLRRGLLLSVSRDVSQQFLELVQVRQRHVQEVDFLLQVERDFLARRQDHDGLVRTLQAGVQVADLAHHHAVIHVRMEVLHQVDRAAGLLEDRLERGERLAGGVAGGRGDRLELAGAAPWKSSILRSPSVLLHSTRLFFSARAMFAIKLQARDSSLVRR